MIDMIKMFAQVQIVMYINERGTLLLIVFNTLKGVLYGSKEEGEGKSEVEG